MNAMSIPPIAMAILMFYVGFYHFLIYRRQKYNRENLTFALSCFGVGLYSVCCAGLYNVSSPEVGVEWQRFQVISLAVLAVFFLWFIADYTGHTNRKIVKGFTLYYLIAALVGLLIRNDLTWTNIASIKTIRLPFGYDIRYNEMAPGILTDFQSIVGLIYCSYIIMVGLKFYRSGNKEKGLPLLVGISMFFAGNMNDTFVSSGFYDFIYILEYSYIGMILMFTFFLTNKVIKAGEVKAALQESESKFRQIYDNILDVYYEASLDGVILEISPSIARNSQYKREELIGKSLYDIYANPADRDKLIEIIIIKESVRDYEINLFDKDGSQHLCSMNIELIKDTKSKPIKIIGIFRDISERKKAEDEKINAQKIAGEREKLALVGQVAGKMAHDFNNILGIIMGNTELALVDCPDDQIKKTLELIYNQTIRGKNLTKNLVAFAKDQEPKQEFFSIDDKMDLILNLLKKDLEGINVSRQYNTGIPPLLADSGMIEHAIINLVQNSIHAVSLAERPEIIVRISHQKKTIFIEIEDNGCGIPPEFIGEIYEPSFTLKGSKDKSGMYKSSIKGTGYGMSNVKRYIEQHKGNVSIHSELHKGTKVTINLPVVKKELTNEEIADVKKEKIYSERYILLIEDEQAISDVQYSILTHEPCNHNVDIANNGQIAIDLFNRNEYELISLDYVLPGNINGMDVYNHIRETNKAIPILFISGNIEFLESIKNLKQKDPYIDHRSKPCNNLDYINSINSLMSRVGI